MSDNAVDDVRTRRRRSRHKHKRKNRKREKLQYNLRWLLGGLAVGLPLLAATLYLASRF